MDFSTEEQKDLLRRVSRSFFLTLRILPATIREQIGLAYLLGRAADTLSDSKLLLPEQRLKSVQLYKELIYNRDTSVIRMINTQLQDSQQGDAEILVLQNLNHLYALLEQYTENDQKRIRKVLATLIECMLFDLTTFPMAESKKIYALRTWEEMERYTYMAAGCVGEFWTEMSIAHIPQLQNWNTQHYTELGKRLGKGLQVVNILRDFPRDLRIGRCYLPETILKEHSLTVEMLLDKNNNLLSLPILRAGTQIGIEHFIAATDYVIGIPRRCIRLRLAALWPLLIGLSTLEKILLDNDWLNVDHVSKVKRGWVYRMMFISLLCVGSNTLIKLWQKTLTRKVLHQMQT